MYPVDFDITLDRENEFKKSLDEALGYGNVIGICSRDWIILTIHNNG
jgi:hypothetical protein